MMEFQTCILLFILPLMAPVFSQQLVSPCPRLFKYENNNPENDRWYGTITLLSESELSGVWLRLIFDKQSVQLGNWLGEVVTQDNKDYLIKDRNHKLLANTPYNVRFYVKYNPGETPPQLTGFRLNAKTVCPENEAATESPTPSGLLITSSALSTTTESPPPNSGNTFEGFNQGVPNSEEDDDSFQGDFAIFNNRRPVKPTLEAQFPWHASLYHVKGMDLTYICGASLVTRNHLITVAHCVIKRKTQETLDPENLVAYLGKYHLRGWSNAGIQDKPVKEITIHPKFNAQIFNNDIAILKLNSPVEITDYVRPVSLWEEDVSLESVVNKPGTVVGWSFDENGRVVEKLTKTQMAVVSQEICIHSFPNFYPRSTPNNTFCAGFRNGTSVCNGDSGGGMVFPKSTSNPNNPIWQLRGLVSISLALQSQSKCDSSSYVVFTDVAKYLDWIRASLN